MGNLNLSFSLGFFYYSILLDKCLSKTSLLFNQKCWKSNRIWFTYFSENNIVWIYSRFLREWKRFTSSRYYLSLYAHCFPNPQLSGMLKLRVSASQLTLSYHQTGPIYSSIWIVKQVCNVSLNYHQTRQIYGSPWFVKPG